MFSFLVPFLLLSRAVQYITSIKCEDFHTHNLSTLGQLFTQFESIVQESHSTSGSCFYFWDGGIAKRTIFG